MARQGFGGEIEAVEKSKMPDPNDKFGESEDDFSSSKVVRKEPPHAWFDIPETKAAIAEIERGGGKSFADVQSLMADLYSAD